MAGKGAQAKASHFAACARRKGTGLRTPFLRTSRPSHLAAGARRKGTGAYGGFVQRNPYLFSGLEVETSFGSNEISQSGITGVRHSHDATQRGQSTSKE